MSASHCISALCVANQLQQYNDGEGGGGNKTENNAQEKKKKENRLKTLARYSCHAGRFCLRTFDFVQSAFRVVPSRSLHNTNVM